MHLYLGFAKADIQYFNFHQVRMLWFSLPGIYIMQYRCWKPTFER